VVRGTKGFPPLRNRSQNRALALGFLDGGGMAGAMFLTHLLPRLSPKHFEVDSFRSTYLQIMLMLVSLLAYVHAVVLWMERSHPSLEPGRRRGWWSVPAICPAGKRDGKIRRNFYIRIRLP
jgi:hypothetical protein